MPRVYNCSFCGRAITPGTGMIHVKNDGTILRFCSRKCRVSMLEMGRDPRKVTWVRKSSK